MFTGAWPTSAGSPGHSYIVYGPLALAATSVLYEEVPTYPDAGRVWRIAERLDVNIFHTSPTAIRMLRKSGHDEPTKYKYHFKHMTTVGKPMEPRSWRWYLLTNRTSPQAVPATSKMRTIPNELCKQEIR